MAVRKLSLSLTPELAEALDELARRRGDDRSRLVETLLREHPLVRRHLEAARGLQVSEPSPPAWESVGARKRRTLGEPPA